MKKILYSRLSPRFLSFSTAAAAVLLVVALLTWLRLRAVRRTAALPPPAVIVYDSTRTADSLRSVAYAAGRERRKAVAALFNPLTGECYVVSKTIRGRISDAGSYTHVRTTYTEGAGGVLNVKTDFTARNGFNAVRRGIAEAEVDTAGRVLNLYIY